MAWYDTLSGYLDFSNTIVTGGVSLIVNDLVGSVQENVDNFVEDHKDEVENFGILGDNLTQFWKDQLIELMAWVTDEIRLYKYKFSVALNDWLNNSVCFWITVAAVAVLVYYAPELTSWITSSSGWAFAVKVFDYLKQAAGNFLEDIRYTQLLDIHKVFLLLNVKYADFWKDLDEGFMAIAEQMELGVGTINLITQNVRNLYYSVYSMVGVDVDTVEAKYYDDITKFWKKTNDDMESYVKNPQLIFDAVQRELVYPILTEQAQHGVDRAKFEIAISESIDDTIKSVTSVQDALADLKKSFGKDVADIFDAKTEKVLGPINEFIDENVKPFQERLEGVTAILKQTTNEMQEAIWKNAIERGTTTDIIASALFNDDLEIGNKRNLISMLFSKILSPELEAQSKRELALVMTTPIDKDDVPENTEVVVPDKYIPLFDLKLSDIQASAEPWFVGEY